MCVEAAKRSEISSSVALRTAGTLLIVAVGHNSCQYSPKFPLPKLYLQVGSCSIRRSRAWACEEARTRSDLPLRSLLMFPTLKNPQRENTPRGHKLGRDSETCPCARDSGPSNHACLSFHLTPTFRLLKVDWLDKERNRRR